MRSEPRKHDLYQVQAENREGAIVLVGPAMAKGPCEQLAQAIRTQIRLGREKTWSNPHVARILTTIN